ncbi:YpiF family protein [Bacillus suaedaesalsae]|uniref:YpiF family protein n=1 Tax=Bacillus suaedaesalsae TaxID=2810349 RepID=A0ABS2DN06_9BACI|nr:YpiF family protein [Bacillus suaedaesalsae]MBM6619848.1 YpiF family protein [Bacillus suaedaesalsae]
MKWMTTDVDLYIQSKQYVDTAIIPLIPVDFSEGMKNKVLEGEFITILSNEIERQFKGRMFLFPPITYLSEETNLFNDLERLKDWKMLAITKGFKHVIFLTSDAAWKEHEQVLESSLICLSPIPLEHVDGNLKQQIMTDQVQALVPLLLKAWRN